MSNHYICTVLMIRQLLILCLLAAFAVQTFNRVAIVVNYYANTSSFIKNCENKAKPQLHCNGRCQMMKKLKHEDNKDQQNSDRKNSSKDEVISSKSFFASLVAPLPFFAKIFYPQITFTTKDFSSDFFHPPAA